MLAGDKIILGLGIFAINSIPVALCKGGGKLEIVREYKAIEADGDYGMVKGRVLKYKSEAKLTMSALTVIPANYVSYYPGLVVTTDATKTTITATTSHVLADTDFITVTWTGQTKDGKAVCITLLNAINLDKIDWAMKFKDEVVHNLVYTATYDEATKDTEPWNITFAI